MNLTCFDEFKPYSIVVLQNSIKSRGRQVPDGQVRAGGQVVTVRHGGSHTGPPWRLWFVTMVFGIHAWSIEIFERAQFTPISLHGRQELLEWEWFILDVYQCITRVVSENKVVASLRSSFVYMISLGNSFFKKEL